MSKLLLVSASAKPGGAERAFLSLARGLPAHGWEPVCVLLEDGPLREWLESNVVVLDAGRTRRLDRTAATVRALARIAREHDARAVVSSLSKTHVYGGVAARLARVPAVWWQHGIPARSTIEFAAGRIPAAAVVCVSDASARAQRALTPRRRVDVVHPGVPVDEIAAAGGSGAAIRASLGWNDARVIGVLGRLQRDKGHEDALHAFASLAATRPELRLAIVGGAVLGWEGAYPLELAALAERLGVADRVHFAGHQGRPADWLDAFDVAVHAATNDSFGLAVVEAMALGKPVVATAAEIVEDERSGLLVPPHDPAALERALARVLDEDGLASGLGARARERARDLDESHSTAVFARVLDEVTGRRLRVLQLGMGWFPDQTGGLNRYFRGLLTALGDTRGVVVGDASDAPPSVVGLSARDAALLRRLRAVRRALKRIDADVIDAHFALYAFAARTLRRVRRIPLVVHFHGPWADEGAVEGANRIVVAAKRAIERSVYRRARVVVTMSSAFKELVVADYGVEPSRVRVVPAAVELDVFTPGDRAAARARFGLGDELVVACVRRLVPRMGLDVLLDALPEHATLLVAGEGPLRAKLERLAQANVRFLGRLSDEALVDLYRAADVSVVPSLALEGFGLSAAESLACGTPVVVSDAGGLPEVVAGLDETLVVPAGDAAALRARLAAPLPPRGACRVHAERFAWETVAARHRELYAAAARPRIVFLDHTAVLSGGELALLRVLPELDVDAHAILAQDGPFADALRDRGISVEILTLAESTRDLPRERTLSPVHLLRTLGYAVRLARRIRQLDANVVHTNSLKSALYGGLAARLARVPAVWHVRDRIAPDYLPRGAVWLVRAASVLLPSAIVANSQATLRTLPPRRRSFVVPSPVEVDARRNGANGTLRIGMVGRIAPWKGQHVFLEAFARAFPDGDSVARIVGAPLFGADEEEYARSLPDLAERLGVAGRVDFAGFRTDVGHELAQLDVLVHASVLPEPFGQVVVEGMAAGLPVVAAAAGGPAEVVEAERTGLLYPPGDTDALAGALRRLAGDEALRARLGDAARTRAREFAPGPVARRIENVYRELRR